MNLIINLANEDASKYTAQRLAACLYAPLTLTFSGEIGAGKTTFIRALLQSLGIKAAIKSPTFSLVESYQLPNMHIHHFDLYRIHDESELEYIGFRDYFADNVICCIEWPERVHCLDFADIGFTLMMKGVGREMHAHAFSPAGIEILTCLAGES
ncbi:MULTISPECIES: tRNA (adenosine(37)-N6)-threonylcarbamoyltransferase complex ATPase subunit type 1 TsaE [Legionella]|uniref:tRNA threonylcarbamoyladenosine biosynthesis protein TsaE n=1 Tax=Legionella septentrionalis TaxID=2498109 RepID=A0A3S0WSP6_9GAMM|nr:MULTISPECIES: tRNA (adenosine(37)-N6)-threonylcarbamoyltransferase complex ATPase subunit type 1 TsaE [Legionella]MCP0914575.1 tRNA (adenosine(37)-N6)-threonylcarbamoyltransferase complex ATPase subunit type 1 TsaE [Legionella sp. 27cVA30]RUQ90037.1 tRNA (adenosine(37)-N6)-threonylcarbamoyltransferase complex ATPase subunit type 1 TsaE [Legionella septentrionalis]RUQ95502.1 tRNA (adenosine(37)-N6)-threonylcarbamoyltransferase complex ATPase subunit type 1 TsaE [Legionella septentrionalis]